MNVKWAARVQDIFTVAKVLALIIIIVVGLYNMMFNGRVSSFENMFANTSTDVGSYAVAIYGGLFAYGGWNYLNFVTEELKDPYRNLPRAILISVPMVTVIYVLANIAYFAAMSPAELLASQAVAVTFGINLLGVMAFIMPISVALSTFGGVNGLLLTGSRLYFVGARMGHLPQSMAMNQRATKDADALLGVNVVDDVAWGRSLQAGGIPSRMLWPGVGVYRQEVSLSWMLWPGCILSLLYLLARDIGQLINYFSFVQWSATGAAIAGLLYLRYSQPDLPRPVKVNIALPIIFLIASIFLVIMGVVGAPWDTAIGIGIFLSGIPVYLLFVWWNKFPSSVTSAQNSSTIWLQKLFVMVSEEKKVL
ncbi:putative large neutral amino acids transporter small subunit 1-like isoform X1 [Apostichopus japonicus]|uniref:Putative large neutral amino acids transporter small subunit 1-like isoform X1 n=1 Tax=Stichopus japonicus TaxID=307972 RepID=A0A2G8LNI8_STIJA|nr:putative large neutral amino acids transporter small subunit 1-like isoform X1 [Apostichopus japonicus]